MITLFKYKNYFVDFMVYASLMRRSLFLSFGKGFLSFVKYLPLVHVESVLDINLISWGCYVATHLVWQAKRKLSIRLCLGKNTSLWFLSFSSDRIQILNRSLSATGDSCLTRQTFKGPIRFSHFVGNTKTLKLNLGLSEAEQYFWYQNPLHTPSFW